MRKRTIPIGSNEVLIEPVLPTATLEPSARVNKSTLDNLKALDLVEFNREAEQMFLSMLDTLCKQIPDGVNVRALRAECAFKLGISTETAKRYIEKYCVAFSAPYQLRGGNVVRKK